MDKAAIARLTSPDNYFEDFEVGQTIRHARGKTMTALENVTLGLVQVKGISRDEADDIGRSWLEKVGLSDKINSYPAELSGGLQQSVGIDRAVVVEPKIVLSEELTSALDPELVGEVLSVMKSLAEDYHMTMLVVTHDMLFANEVANQMVFMDEGVVIVDGPPATTLRDPKTDRLRSFLRRFEQIL